MNVETLPFPTVKRNPKLDGEGSLQVQLDPDMKIGNAKVFAIYGKGGIGNLMISQQAWQRQIKQTRFVLKYKPVSLFVKIEILTCYFDA